MVRILREQPEDPIMFLAEVLLQHSEEKHSLAEEKAREMVWNEALTVQY